MGTLGCYTVLGEEDSADKGNGNLALSPLHSAIFNSARSRESWGTLHLFQCQCNGQANRRCISRGKADRNWDKTVGIL